MLFCMRRSHLSRVERTFMSCFSTSFLHLLNRDLPPNKTELWCLFVRVRANQGQGSMIDGRWQARRHRRSNPSAKQLRVTVSVNNTSLVLVGRRQRRHVTSANTIGPQRSVQSNPCPCPIVSIRFHTDSSSLPSSQQPPEDPPRRRHNYTRPRQNKQWR
jgi:hypothetical protein